MPEYILGIEYEVEGWEGRIALQITSSSVQEELCFVGDTVAICHVHLTVVAQSVSRTVSAKYSNRDPGFLFHRKNQPDHIARAAIVVGFSYP